MPDPVAAPVFLQTIDPLLGGPPQADAAGAEAAARFLDPGLAMARFVVGRNAQSECLARHLPLTGLIDDRAPPGSLWQGLPVVRMSAVPRDAWVVNASSSIAPVSVERALAAAGLERVLTLADLLAAPDGPPGLLPDFTLDLRAELAAHRAAWDSLYARLADDESRRVLLDVVRFRLCPDPAWMADYRVRFEDQYFEDFLGLHGETFVDAGGYDGDTTEQFCRRVPDYRKVHFFEPSPVNMAAARLRLAGLGRIEFHTIGLSDARAELGFDAGSGSASSVSDSGSQRIEVDRLDDLVQETVSFIKMDLEGWELHALRGAAGHIRQDRPKLAISVYHQASHFREVCDLVLGLCPDYQVRLRHYTEGWSETVMFFTP